MYEKRLLLGWIDEDKRTRVDDDTGNNRAELLSEGGRGGEMSEDFPNDITSDVTRFRYI
jgi:hypothetical protein